MRLRLMIPIVVCALLVTPAVRGQLAKDAIVDPVRLVIFPAAEPARALEHRLLPPFIEMHPGNAVVYYGKVKAEQNAFFSQDDLWRKVEHWMEMPLDELRLSREAEAVLAGRSVFYFMDEGARCETCDWQLPIRREVFYLILLPEVQETRGFARLLAARARWQISRGNYDDALRTLQTGNALARHVAQGPTIVNGLVGNAIAGTMLEQLEVLLQQPDAPNLYWALTQLPQPLIDMRPGIDAETFALQMTIPALGDVENMERRPEEWRLALLDLWKLLSQMDEFQPKLDYSEEALNQRVKEGYPKAKQALLDWGVPEAQVQTMSVEHVVVWFTMHTYEALRDDVVKWASVPYVYGQEECIAAHRKIIEQFEENEIIPAARVLLTPVGNLRSAFARIERRIALHRTIEALRMHAAAHDGRFPKALTDVTVVPIPNDPVSGQPFTYEVVDDIARISGPSLPASPLKYELKIGKFLATE